MDHDHEDSYDYDQTSHEPASGGKAKDRRAWQKNRERDRREQRRARERDRESF